MRVSEVGGGGGSEVVRVSEVGGGGLKLWCF